jgi:hypothetical protein
MSSRRAMQSPSDTSSWMTLRWVRGTRYYRVHLEHDLWNEWLVTQVCRRIGLGRALAPPALRSSLRSCSLPRLRNGADSAAINCRIDVDVTNKGERSWKR